MCCKIQILAVVHTIAGSEISRRPQDLALRSSGFRRLQQILFAILPYFKSHNLLSAPVYHAKRALSRKKIYRYSIYVYIVNKCSYVNTIAKLHDPL